MSTTDTLFDYAVAKPDGFTMTQACDDLALNADRFTRAVKNLRLILGSDDINLVCDPNGQRQRWVYRLVGNLEQGSPWVANRLKDTESRINTLDGVTKSLVNATDGRTNEGRKARVMHKAIARLSEDLAEIDAWGV